MKKTYLEDEIYAYPNGGQTRKGRAIYPDGKIRRVWAGIPDNYFSIPAHGRVNGVYVAGYLTILSYPLNHEHEAYGEWMFNPNRR